MALRERTTVSDGDRAPMRGEPLAWWVAGYMGVQSMAFYGGLAWLPEILQDDGYSDAAAGTLQALASLVSVVPAFLVPVVASRRRTQGGLAIAIMVAAAIGIAGLLVAPGVALAWVLLIGVGQGGSLGLGLILPVLRAGGAAAVASLTAMSLGVGFLVASTGPWVLGAVHDLAGNWTAPLVALLVITVAQVVPGVPAGRARVVHPR